MRNIITADSKEGSILRQQCYQVQVPNDQTTVDSIVNMLKETINALPESAGIAAPQIGFLKRIAIINKSVIGSTDHLILINPEVKAVSCDTITEVESCLSFPGMSKRVKRFQNITVSTLINTRLGDSTTTKFSGYPARVIQHEVDHLNGITLIDK